MLKLNKKIASIVISIFTAFSLYAEKISFKADSMSGVAAKNSDYTKLEGSASVKTETMEIAADTIELSGKDFRYITATGNVKGNSSESKMDFTCGKMTYDRDTKIATLSDAVHLIDQEHNVTAEAQIIEYDQDKETAVMQIGVNITQKENTCTAAYAIYRKKDQMLDMNGNPKVVQGQDSFRAQTISLNLDTQEITLDGRVSGSVTTKKESQPAKTSDSKPEQNKEPEQSQDQKKD